MNFLLMNCDLVPEDELLTIRDKALGAVSGASYLTGRGRWWTKFQRGAQSDLQPLMLTSR